MAGEGGMHVTIYSDKKHKLGTPGSHGCTRVARKLQTWIYNKLPTGTRVINW